MNERLNKKNNNSSNLNQETSLLKIINNNNIDNDDNAKLNKDDGINEFEEKYYFDDNKSNKITLKDKIYFITYILIGSIIILHSIHFTLSEYVRRIINYKCYINI